MSISPSSRSISSLPSELLHQILTYLPIPTLLTFAQTSKQNYAASISALETLELAVLPRRIYGVLTFLNSFYLDDPDGGDAYDDFSSHYQVTVLSELSSLFNRTAKKTKHPQFQEPKLTPLQYREQLFALHNSVAHSVLSTPTLSKLQTLRLHLYHLTSPELTGLLATAFHHLRNLHLNFSHPYLHDTCLPAHYWTSPMFLKGSPVWNSLAGLGDEHASKLKLRTLESLTLERAGITSVQLRRWIERNPRLRQLTLRNVLGVDKDFVDWLGQHHSPQGIGAGEKSKPARLRRLALEHCSSLSLRATDDFNWLDHLFDTASEISLDARPSVGYSSDNQLKCLENFSLRGSKSASVSIPNFLTYLEARKPAVRQIILPDGRTLVAKPPVGFGAQGSDTNVLDRGGATKHASTRSLNDIDDGYDLLKDNTEDGTGDNDTVSFLCEKKQPSSWWVTKDGVRGGRNMLQPENGIIEADDDLTTDSSRLSRPALLRLRP